MSCLSSNKLNVKLMDKVDMLEIQLEEKGGTVKDQSIVSGVMSLANKSQVLILFVLK